MTRPKNSSKTATKRGLFDLEDRVGAQPFWGLILPWSWRRSGDMAMNGTLHAISDAPRNALAG